ncbi:MAG: M48 family metalloprotease [Blastocatellia bacterium]|nr:M48 family metalloprotease [Blastocatellia bacterium]
MKNAILIFLFVCSSVMGGWGQTPPAPQSPPFPSWTPPPARKENTSVQAPKVRKGNNIFQGEAETWLLHAMFDEADYTRLNAPEISKYVSQVGQNLVPYCAAPQRKFEFVVLQEDSPVAFTPGGGMIFISTGLLRDLESEDELAGLLAHEMGHDVMQHMPKTITRKLFWMIGVRAVKSQEETQKAVEKLYEAYRKNRFADFMESLSGIGRKDEIEADSCAFYTTYKAGYNPYGVGNVLKRLEARFKALSGNDYSFNVFTDFFIGTHPPTGQRAAMLSWERAFVKAPPKNSRVESRAFEAMRERLHKKD